MGVVDVATATNIDPSQGALAVANNLRIASLTIAAYEYVASYASLTLHSDLWPVSSSHSLLKFAYTRLRVDVGEKGQCQDERIAL